MARIRTIKPYFVDHRGFTLPRLIYSGDMLQSTDLRELSTGWSVAYVYHMFNQGGDLLYVGMTTCPVNRFDAHRRKAPWWNQAAALNLYRIEGRDKIAAEHGARHWEALAIRGALPQFNLCGPANLPAKEDAR